MWGLHREGLNITGWYAADVPDKGGCRGGMNDID
jgi:hypothetical protein